ncbi:MAG: hypothetical protein ACM3XM_04045 [Mycobacterium leprae]
MWQGVHGFPVFPVVLLAFIMVMSITRLIMFRRYGWMGRCCGHSGYHDSRFEAEALLRRRLVNGEIKEEEYQRLKEILSK